MRILIDECIDERFRSYYALTIAKRLARLGWTQEWRVADCCRRCPFDVFVTVDQGIEYQQKLPGRQIAIIILCAKSNRLADLAPLAPACLSHLESIGPGQLLKIGT